MTGEYIGWKEFNCRGKGFDGKEVLPESVRVRISLYSEPPKTYFQSDCRYLSQGYCSASNSKANASDSPELPRCPHIAESA